MVFVLSSWEVRFLFLFKALEPGVTEIEATIFHSLGNDKDHLMDYFFCA